MTNAIEMFLELEGRYKHPQRGNSHSDERFAFTRANEQLYFLAQRICRESAPQIQDKLDAARRSIVAAIVDKSEGSLFMRPIKMRRPIRWNEYLLTPELEGNLALSGTRVPRELAIKLQIAHREQLECLKTIFGGQNGTTKLESAKAK